MADEGYATSTVDRTWLYLNQACQWALRQRQIKTNPAADVLLPAARPAKARKLLTIEQAQALLVDGIPGSTRPADVAHRPDVRPPPGRARRTPVAVRGH